MADSNYSFAPADGWCFLLLDDHNRYSSGFRLAGWRSCPNGEVVGMVAVTPPSSYGQGKPLTLASVPPVPGHYRYWDDLSPEAKDLVARG